MIKKTISELFPIAMSQHPIYELIHSLDQTERRYFTLQAKRHAIGGKNTYLKLFEAIARQLEPDDEKLKKIIPADQLASHKHYLFQMILKAMRGYQSGKGVEIQLRELIQDIAFLEAKRMFATCKKTILKGKAIANKYDRFQEVLTLLDIERRLVKMVAKEDLSDELHRIEQERRKVTLRLDIQYQYIELYDRLFTTVRQQLRLSRAQGQQTIRNILGTPLLSDASIALSFHANSYFFLCNAYCHQLLGDFESAYTMYAANIAHWDCHPERAKDEPYQFQRALGNYLGICQITERWEAFPDGLARMKGLEGSTIQERSEHFGNYYFYAFSYFMNSWRFEEAIQWAPEIENGLRKFGEIIPDSRRIGFIYNLMVMFFFLGKHKESLRWLNKLIHAEKSEARQDVQRAVRLFLLILHYQLGNLDLYDHLFPSVLRYLGHQGINEFEQTLLAFLKHVYLGEGKRWPLYEAHNLIAELESMSMNASDSHYPGIREVIIWLKAVSEGKSMLEIGRRGK